MLMEKKMEELDMSPYNRACFHWWLAVVMEGGSSPLWMSDYDTVALGLSEAKGVQIEDTTEGRFTSFELHVPSLIVANAVSFIHSYGNGYYMSVLGRI